MIKKIIKVIILALLVINLVFVALNLSADSSSGHVPIKGRLTNHHGVTSCACQDLINTCKCYLPVEILNVALIWQYL
ncbi:MAG: hypothetical protein ISS28_06970 [Candidatus Cloacimonetes bacterium]|nr:hypothetical protein [Candidatus Cloacimonadota bacterium]